MLIGASFLSRSRRRNRAAAAWFVAATLLICAAATTRAWAQFKDIESHVTEFTLKNGMKFIVLERHEAPVAAFLTYANVGSAQEVKGITGLAHLFEHMAFKGSRHIGTKDARAEQAALVKVDAAFLALRDERLKGAKGDPEKLKRLEAAFQAAQDDAGKFVTQNEFGDAIERAGGHGLNAQTAADQTIYFFSLPSNESELWFYLESERFLDPVLREFYQEKEVVMEERRLSVESQPQGKMIEEFLAVAYKAHPYGEPTVGHMSDVQNITRADAAAFFKRYYIPNNLIAVIVGDVDPRRMKALAEAYFERIPRGPEPEPLRTVEPPQEGERRVTLRLQSERMLVIGYHKPDVNDADNAVYDAIGSLLSDGRSSRLSRSLVRDQKLAVDVGGFPGFPGQKYPGLFLFYAFAAPEHTNAELERAWEREAERLRKEPVSAAELEGVKRRARANLLRSLDDNSGMAQALATWQGLTGDWHNLFKQVDKINAVTPAYVQRVAKVMFTPSNRTVGTIEPAEPAAAQ